jgi:hypothetical protein
MLDKLKNKPIPKQKKTVEVIIGRKPLIIDKTNTGFDANTFLSKLKPKVDIKNADEPIKDVDYEEEEPKFIEIEEPKAIEIEEPKVIEIEIKKPKKLKKKIKIIDSDVDSDKEPEKESNEPKKIDEAELKISEEVPKEPEVIKIPKKEKEPEVIKIPKKSKIKKYQPLVTQIENIDEERFKKVKNVDVRVSSYYMNNRESFINFINKIFHPYREILEKEENDISCENLGKSENRDLMIHQRIVRDYINLYTPYRGLLLYHGLGSGKTCSSIGIVEGMKNEKRVIIMTPASLRANYMSQLKDCGDYMYKLNQFWEWFPVTKETERELSAVLSLPLEEVRRKGGAWLVNVKKKPNYNELSKAQKEEVNSQINKMIVNKYQFINYNGLRLEKLREMTDNFQVNLFDNSVIVIDEAHNFISRIVNKLNKTKDVDLKDPSSLSLILYKFLLSCENSRIVLLTGTPMVNYPNEIGILFNILRGYIKTWKFTLDAEKIDSETLQELLEVNKHMDYFEYLPSTKMLTITRNPMGFENVFKKDKYVGVRDERGDDGRFVEDIIQTLKRNKINVKGKPKMEMFKCLPDTLEEFSNMFIENNKMKNENLFKRRIIGLTSYFKSAQEDLMPRYNVREDLHVVDIPMSDYQFEIYEKARIQERKLEKNSKKDDTKESSSTYRIFSRLFCNYVMPEDIGRPLPNGQSDVEIKGLVEDVGEDLAEDPSKSEVGKSENLTNMQARIQKQKRREEKAKKKEEEKARKLEEKARKAEEKAQEKAKKAEEKAKKAESKTKKVLEQNKTLKTDPEGDFDIDENIDESLENFGDATYDIRIRDAMKKLIEGGPEYLSEEALQKYSPKYLEILRNIKNPENEGLNLVYSQFRTLEGIGIFSEVLKFNGFVEFKVIKTSKGWDIDMEIGVPAFALYTGTEGDEEKELIRKIYNGQWNDSGFPVNIAKKLNAVARNNDMGEIIKVFMITASGSEGINLRNTRFVHIMEPYWNPARIEQVVGRARRICSHQGLPKELQTVEVFVYLMIFTETQIKASKELRKMDLSKRPPKQPVSSDYALYEINLIKSELSQEITRAIKESSIDCAIHPNNKDLVCMNFGTNPSDGFITTPSVYNEQSDKITKMNVKKRTWKARAFYINGIQYAYNEDTRVIYDYDAYKRDELKRLGERVKNGSNYEIHWD